MCIIRYHGKFYCLFTVFLVYRFYWFYFENGNWTLLAQIWLWNEWKHFRSSLYYFILEQKWITSGYCYLLSNFIPESTYTEELSFMTLKNDAKFQEKLTCGLENDMRNWANFHQRTWKSQSWDFDGILLSKVENVWVIELQSYISWRGIDLLF